jgi:hypothetical protein
MVLGEVVDAQCVNNRAGLGINSFRALSASVGGAPPLATSVQLMGDETNLARSAVCPLAAAARGDAAFDP